MDMMQLGHSVAAMVDIGWVANRPARGDNSVVLNRFGMGMPKDYGVILWHDEYRKKISISGLYPKASDGTVFPILDSDRVSRIYVTDSKQPKLIAKDIRERFLPEYNPIYAAACEAAIRHEAYIRDRDALASRFARLLRGKVLDSRDRVDGGPSINAKHDRRGYVHDFYVSGTNGTVDMHR